MNNNQPKLIDTFFLKYDKWMLPSLSVLTPIIFTMELTHLGSDDFKYYSNIYDAQLMTQGIGLYKKVIITLKIKNYFHIFI